MAKNGRYNSQVSKTVDGRAKEKERPDNGAKQGSGSCSVLRARAVHQVVSEHVSCLQLLLCLRWGVIKHLEEEEVLGKTGRPVSSSTVDCPHSPAPTLQLRQIL